MKKVFECRRCGECCRGESTVSLSPEEVRRLAHFLGLSEEEFRRKYLVEKKYRLEMRTVKGYCIFFDRKERLCRVHPVKPERCKEWPLHPSILKYGESFEIIRSTCPGWRKDLRWKEVKEYLEAHESLSRGY